MSMDVTDPLGGQMLNRKSTGMTMREISPGDEPSSGPGDDTGAVQPSYSWQDRTMNQIRERDDPDGDLKTGTEGPGKPPL